MKSNKYLLRVTGYVRIFNIYRKEICLIKIAHGMIDEITNRLLTF